MKRILVVLGTDREATRIVPVAAAMRERSECVVGVCVATRGEAALKPLFEAFGIVADYGPDPICPEPAIARPSSALLDFLGGVYRKFAPDVVLTTGGGVAGVAAALSASQRQIPVAQVAAGVRSRERLTPWSAEQMNSRVVEALASRLFVTTPAARDALMADGVSSERILLTGDTAMDALAPVAALLQRDLSLRLRMSVAFPFLDARRTLIFASFAPRGEGQGMLQDFCRALRTTARLHPEVQVAFPMDPFPGFRTAVEAILKDVPGIHLIERVDYVSSVHLMMRSQFMVSDTDDLGAEASALGKRLLVACGPSARAGAEDDATMVSAPSDPDFLAAAMHRLLEELRKHRRPTAVVAPGSEPSASRRIAQALIGAAGGPGDAGGFASGIPGADGAVLL